LSDFNNFIYLDKGYSNPIIDWTVPAVNETIALETTQIQIGYKIPIECSSKYVSIYQKLDDVKVILRETYSGESNTNCQVLSDNTTLSLTLLPSTFNQPDSVYYVKIDADFVKRSKTSEPLLGILKNKWIFTTSMLNISISLSLNIYLTIISRRITSIYDR
jgi:hypothetical protein